ncbi:hypothetical protein [cf. Phormidesmis sp. LEGE 11477]|uniref:hypothetical protein n=1 Tax=cf. Phormidesmis sp. LEGE 11477 TaxID=1828680 RepID=UPI001881CB5D|nr:hypothetical protein [cf. Phormidesmis sp. LEGE 11477]MBE9064816.1 hypothetical protein [cf. Phormidesmis sp. LEGE 11477]
MKKRWALVDMSGPYQSNILRFLVGQYRLGLDRHRRAVVTTRSTVALGAEVGAVLAMAPAYAVVRLSQSARQKLRGAVAKRRLPAVFSKAISRLESVGGELMVRSRSLVPNEAASEEGVSKELLDQKVDKKTGSLAERITFRPISKAVSALVTRTASILRTAVGRMVPVESDLPVEGDQPGSEEICESAIATTSQFTDLPASPSADLPTSAVSSHPANSSLVWPTRSFWVALLEAVANLKPRWNVRRLKSASAALPDTVTSELPGSCQLSQLSLEFVNAVPLPVGKTGEDLRPVPPSEADLNVTTDRLLDVKVTAFEYVEHPLETALKWVDRVLTWLENRWKTLAEVWQRWLASTRDI